MDPISPPSPPTHPALELADRPRSRWPTVIGIVSLICAVGGLLCNTGCGLWLVLGNLVPEVLREGRDVPTLLRVVGAIESTLVLALGVMLLIGAVGLLRRRRASVALLRKWVLMRLTLLTVGVGWTFLTLAAHVQMERSAEQYKAKLKADNPDNPWIQLPSSKTDERIRRDTMLFTLVHAGVVGAYPLCLGLWLTRRKIVDEVETWTD